ncbi:putative pectinesterase/pectinesterase inhibitor 28 [Prosopis cineraria]|uniref:putative pectinesterase/pectinesterase inhibitor 28 n=1 Tax=Prosopis cineraria TaxID=364024 RepID=UPI0024104848|nr:putative pectinesterase/pectinesterase inhibitor 28 [Prosopis cineraria]
MSGDGQNKRRIAIIGISSILLVGMVVAVTVGVTWKQTDSDEEDKASDKTVSNKVKAVQSLCAPTDYKRECEESLEAEAGNSTDPKDLIMKAFNVTIKKIEKSLRESDTLHEAEKDPRAQEALQTCKHLMELSIGEFKKSLNTFETFDFYNLDKILMNLKVWLSGAITYQETCIEGFEDAKSNAGQKMKQALTASMHMSSNGLAIVNDMAEALSNLHITKQGRRLLNDQEDGNEDHHGEVGANEDGARPDGDFEFPVWVDENPAARRLLTSDHKSKLKPDVVVAQDGSGKYKKIKDALKHVPKKNKKPFVIYIKEGVYKEYVEVEKDMTYVVFVGDGGNKTRITGNKNFADGIGTYNTCTVSIEGDHFIAINMGFENSAGPDGHQAVALRVQADFSIFYRCQLDGYQDTLYAHTMRQFYRDCVITGTIDFIFGDAAVVMQNCTFVVRKPNENQQCIVTAQGRKERHQPSALVIQGGSIVSDPKFYKVRFENKAYLARPWKNFSRTIIMETFIDDLIDPEGFLKWDANSTSYKTCWYGEFNNTGPGAKKSHRVKWNGIKNLTAQHALDFTPLRYFKSDYWIRETRIPYNPTTMSSPPFSPQKISSQ